MQQNGADIGLDVYTVDYAVDKILELRRKQ
jgi:hypothetical protein